MPAPPVRCAHVVRLSPPVVPGKSHPFHPPSWVRHAARRGGAPTAEAKLLHEKAECCGRP
eukprot:3631579-Prorocentrum_lima.AAC.1